MTDPRPEPDAELADRQAPPEPAPYEEHTDSWLVDLRLFEDLI